MDKRIPPQYESPPPVGFSQPHGYPHHAHPQNNYPPHAHPQNTYPPNAYPPNSYPPNYPTPQRPANAVVITGGPTIAANFGPSSQSLVCPHCHHSITTKVENTATTKTHLAALVLCVCLCWLCCCCPYCMDSCQAQNHYCPHCNAFLGSYGS